MNPKQLLTRSARLMVAASLVAAGTVMIAGPAHAQGIATINVIKVTDPPNNPQAFAIRVLVDEVVVVQSQISDTEPDTAEGFDLLVQDGGSEVIVEEVDAPGWLSEISCGEVGPTGPELFQAAAVQSPPFTVLPGETWNCRVTNTQAGTIDVQKIIVGDPGDDTFDLTIDGQPALTAAVDGSFSELITVEPDTHTIAETAGPDTNLADYTSVIFCFVGETVVAGPATGPAETNSLNVELSAGDDAVCTVTNTLEAPAEAPDDDYNQYPGDGDFDFEPPFEDADDDDDPASPVVAGANDQNDNGPSGDAPVASAGDPGAPAPAGDVAPQAVSELPRTGSGFAPAGLLTGILMILAGVAALLGGRRRHANQA